MIRIDEKKYIKKAAAGDTGAYEYLVLQYQPQVYRLAFRMTNHPEDAADLTQEVFLKAWNNLDKFEFKSAFSTWLYRLASNLCIDFLRNNRRRQNLPLTFEDEEGEEQRIEVLDPAPLPEERVIAAEGQARLSAAMEELEPEHRQILTLRVVNDLSYADIAEILGVKEGTVKSRLARAREKLRKNYYK